MRALHWRSRVRRLMLSQYSIAFLAIGYFAIVTVISPEIADAGNLANLVATAMPLFVLVLGQTFVLIAGGIDLSAPAVASLCSVAGATVLTSRAGMNGTETLSLALAGMLLLGLAIGTLQGMVIAFLDTPAFLVTLASLMFLAGVGVWWTRAEPIGGIPSSIMHSWQGSIVGIPIMAWLALGIVLAAHGILKHTVFGRQLYAVGLNARAALVSGVPVRTITMLVYALSGLAATIASFFYLIRLGVGSAELVPREMLLDCLGAAVLGGASLSGGKGSVLGALLGTAFIVLLVNSLNFFGLDYWHVVMAKGAVIGLAALIDALRHYQLEVVP